MKTHCSIDHLVIACADLGQGNDWLESKLGVAAQPGGKHPLMGTHNHLLRLGTRTYLELIAIDPDAPAPTRPRWFGLDTTAVRSRAAQRPFLLTWVVASNDVVAAAAKLPQVGEVIGANRGVLTWRITVPADGQLQYDGLLPTVIEWDGGVHPCDGLEDKGCGLLALELVDPDAPALGSLLQALRVEQRVKISAGARRLVARIRTARGEVNVA